MTNIVWRIDSSKLNVLAKSSCCDSRDDVAATFAKAHSILSDKTMQEVEGCSGKYLSEAKTNSGNGWLKQAPVVEKIGGRLKSVVYYHFGNWDSALYGEAC